MLKHSKKKPAGKQKSWQLKSRWPFTKKQSAIFGLVFALVGGAVLWLSFAQSPYKQVDFSSDPGWEAVNNRPQKACANVSPSFGYSSTNKVNGGGAVGEIGGVVPTVGQQKSFYGKRVAPASLSDRLYASGSLILPIAKEDSEVYFGWFNSDSGGWKGNNFLGIYLADTYSAAKPNSAAIGILSTRSGLNDGYGDSGRSGILVPGQKATWVLDYQPSEGSYGTVHMTITTASANYHVDYQVPQSLRADGANFDHFGIFAIQAGINQTGNPNTKTLYMDDLTLHIGPGAPIASDTDHFDKDPGWEGVQNNSAFQDCWIKGRQDFGFSNTQNAGGAGKGELGGVIWLGSDGNQSYYADQVANLKLSDPLYATGKIVITGTHYDTDIPFIGWFNKSTSKWGDPNAPDGENLKIQNFIGTRIGGPGSRGHTVEPVFYNNDKVGNLPDGNGTNPSFNSVEPKGIPRDFWICYVPNADSSGNGRLTTGVTAVPSIGREQRTTVVTIPAAKKTAATILDRFGFITPNIGGSGEVGFYVDDLRYTTASGDNGPADRCGTTANQQSPTITAFSPTDNSYIKDSNTTLSATVTDNVGVAGVQFKLDGNNVGNELQTAPYSISASVANGKHSLTIVARDSAGNQATKNAQFTVDNIVPTVSIIAPSNNANVSGNNVKLSASAADNNAVTSVRYAIDGSEICNVTTAPFDCNWNTTTIANGPHTLAVIALDAATNASDPAIITVNVNNTNPPPGDHDKPSVPQNLHSTNTTPTSASFSWNASTDTGGSGLAGYKIYRNNNLLTTTTDITYTDTGLTDGTAYTYAVSAYDNAQNESNKSPAITITPSDNPPHVMLNAPVDKSYVKGTVVLSADASDDIGVAGLQFKINGQPQGNELPALPYVTNWDSNQVASKLNGYAVTAVVRDATGHTVTSNQSVVTVDNTAPTASISSPKAHSTVKGNVYITANADDNIGVGKVIIMVDGKVIGPEITKAPYRIKWRTTNFDKGDHTISATVTDKAGNSVTTDTTTVTVDNTPKCVDNTPPSIPTNLEHQTVTSSSVDLSWNTSTDTGCSGLAGYAIYRNGTLVGATSSPVYTDTGLLPGTTYSYTVKAVDNAGNNSSASDALQVSTLGSYTGVPGDTNNDGKVDIVDLSILLSHFGTSGPEGDVNHDGSVNIIDLSILLSNFGKW